MTKMVTKVRSTANDVNSARICIDYYDNGIPKGRIFPVSQDSAIDFVGWMTLIKELNRFMDVYDFPQAGMKLRAFQLSIQGVKGKDEGLTKTKQVANEWVRGNLATFKLRILFRQNATWQGTLHWRERGKEERFRSVLELMSLVDSCLISEGYDSFDTIDNNTESVI